MIITDLRQIADTERAQAPPHTIYCCTAAGCAAVGGEHLAERLHGEVTARGMAGQVRVGRAGCMRLCGEGPMVGIDRDGPRFGRVTPLVVPAIVDAVAGRGSVPNTIDRNLPFFTKQMPLVTENFGHVEPERLASNVAAGAYATLERVLHEGEPARVIAAITASGLRGRGGAGYPTGLKWDLVAKTPSPQKYVVCNADEGDPGAFKDRTILDSDPHRVLEGMAIAGFAVGADHGFIYIRGEFTLAIERLRLALQQARQAGLLGSRLFGTAFRFDIELRMGAGAYVCGEETALVASIEGGRGIPRPRPPYPGESGLWGRPTLINNVETLATVVPILRFGPERYAELGVGKSRGTKVFSVSGRVRHTGIVEVPMGTPLRVIVEEIGGGAPEGHTVKAVQTGGPAGGCVPAEHFDTPLDHEAMAALGSIIGSGGMVIIDDRTDLVELAAYFMDFCREESCGKCVPCRVGTVQLHRLLTRVLQRQATPDDLRQLESLAVMVKETSLCGLGQGAPNQMLSTLRFFRREYETKLKS